MGSIGSSPMTRFVSLEPQVLLNQKYALSGQVTNGRRSAELFAQRVDKLERPSTPEEKSEVQSLWEGRCEYDYLKNLVTAFSGEKKIEVKGGCNWFLRTLQDVNQLANQNKVSAVKQKLSGHFGAFPLVLQNPPNARRIEKFNDVSIQALRHPAPTSSYKTGWIKSYTSLIAIIKGIFHAIFQKQQYVMESFKEYINILNEHNKNYLYVNFQSIQKKGKFDVEHKRTKALLDLGREKKNFYFFSQVMDGKFFKKAPKKCDSIDGLSSYLKDALIDGVHGHISYEKLGLSKDEYKDKIGGHVRLVGELFFNNSIDEIKENWTAFLLILYTFERLDWKVILAEKQKQGIVYLTACKDFQDRGNFCAALLDEILLAALTNKIGPKAEPEIEEQFLSDLIIHTVGVPLRSKGQGIISSRLKQGSAALQRLLKLDEGKIDRINQFFNLNPESVNIELSRPPINNGSG